MTNVGKNGMSFKEKVEDLRKAAKNHFVEVYDAKEAKRITESKLDDAERVIKADQEASWLNGMDGWKKERADLILARYSSLTTKGSAEAKLHKAGTDMTYVWAS